MSPIGDPALTTAMGAQPTQSVTGGLRVTVDLIFDGLAFNPANLLAALKTQYGATKVSTDHDALGQNQYQFRIIP